MCCGSQLRCQGTNVGRLLCSSHYEVYLIQQPTFVWGACVAGKVVDVYKGHWYDRHEDEKLQIICRM